jgi:hypothetical protein
MHFGIFLLKQIWKIKKDCSTLIYSFGIYLPFYLFILMLDFLDFTKLNKKLTHKSLDINLKQYEYCVEPLDES